MHEGGAGGPGILGEAAAIAAAAGHPLPPVRAAQASCRRQAVRAYPRPPGPALALRPSNLGPFTQRFRPATSE